MAQLRQQTKPGAVGLLITFAYPQEQMQGPHFHCRMSMYANCSLKEVRG